MTDNELISFVVPAYNEEAKLPRSLRAMLDAIEKSGCNAEVIVVNNASTDNTGDVARGFAGVVVVDEPQKGLVAARSAGFAVASGVLIANIDADTIIDERWIARVIHEFHRDPRLVALSGPYIYYDVPRSTRMLVRAFYVLGFGFYLLNRFVLNVGSLLQGGNFVVRRTAMEAIGGYNPLFTFYGEDTDLARRLHKVGAVKFTFKLPALSSGRRFIGEGLLRIGLRYTMNFIWVTFLHKPFNDTWLDIRQ